MWGPPRPRPAEKAHLASRLPHESLDNPLRLCFLSEHNHFKNPTYLLKKKIPFTKAMLSHCLLLMLLSIKLLERNLLLLLQFSPLSLGSQDLQGGPQANNISGMLESKTDRCFLAAEFNGHISVPSSLAPHHCMGSHHNIPFPSFQDSTFFQSSFHLPIILLKLFAPHLCPLLP